MHHAWILFITYMKINKSEFGIKKTEHINIRHIILGISRKRYSQLPVHLGIDRYSPLNECTLQCTFYMKSMLYSEEKLKMFRNIDFLWIINDFRFLPRQDERTRNNQKKLLMKRRRSKKLGKAWR